MKILWIVNMVLPELAEHMGVRTGSSGTWMINLSKTISETENVKLAVACVYGNEFKKYELNNITYYLIPGTSKSMMFYDGKLAPYWEKIEADFAPDIVHIHGTEYTHSISYLRTFPNKKYLLSIQGIMSKISANHTDKIKLSELIKFRTMKENLHLNGMIERKILSNKAVRFEREIISRVNYATGRTDWDKAFMMSLNPNLKYYRCFYNLREEFYTADKWSYDKCTPHTIYASTSAQSPFKGGYMFLKALALVKEKYPDVKAYFLGSKVVNGELQVTSGYTKYIKHLIDKYNLKDNVEFVTRLDTNGVIKMMQDVNVCVIPSTCENASATLRESIHIGTPSVASFRGGMTDLMEDRKSGFFFDFPDYELLALRICELFEKPEMATEFSKKSIEFAEKIHDPEKNTQDFIDMYKDIVND